MGSRGANKLKGNALKNYKNSLRLSLVQKSILIGSLLGDGTLRVGVRAQEANYKVDHGLKQKEYTFWTYNSFKEWVLTPPKISYRFHPVWGKHKKSWWFRTIRHKEITLFHKLFYRNGRKIVPPNIGKRLDPLSLAVWIMDDGSFNKKRGIYTISTYSFTKTEINLLQQALELRFNLRSKCYSDRDKGFRIFFSKTQGNTIGDLIRPYVVSCLKYKLPPLTP